MVNRFDRGRSVPAETPVPPGARRGVLVGLATDFPATGHEPLRAWRNRHPEHRTFDGKDLSLVPTVFDKLNEKLCRALIYRGWWLMGAALATYHPDRLPDHAQSPLPRSDDTQRQGSWRGITVLKSPWLRPGSNPARPYDR
jgi:NTE family protein